jgi:hypothetical protein
MMTAQMRINAQQANLPVEYASYDLNGDGLLTSDDALVIYDYILNASESVVGGVDLNKDGNVNTVDVVVLYVTLRQYNKFMEQDGGDNGDPSITNPDMEWGVREKRN